MGLSSSWPHLGHTDRFPRCCLPCVLHVEDLKFKGLRAQAGKLQERSRWEMLDWGGGGPVDRQHTLGPALTSRAAANVGRRPGIARSLGFSRKAKPLHFYASFWIPATKLKKKLTIMYMPNQLPLVARSGCKPSLVALALKEWLE